MERTPGVTFDIVEEFSHLDKLENQILKMARDAEAGKPIKPRDLLRIGRGIGRWNQKVFNKVLKCRPLLPDVEAILKEDAA